MNDPQNMEMPVSCANCGDWIELNDSRSCEGVCGVVICDKCYKNGNGVCESCWEDEEPEDTNE